MLLREVSRRELGEGVVAICARNRSLGGPDLHLVLLNQKQGMWRVEEVATTREFEQRVEEIRANYALGKSPNLYPVNTSQYELDSLLQPA